MKQLDLNVSHDMLLRSYYRINMRFCNENTIYNKTIFTSVTDSSTSLTDSFDCFLTYTEWLSYIALVNLWFMWF